MNIFGRVTLPLAGMNFVNQISRTVVATIAPLLAMEFGLSAGQLGLLAACFFVAYAATQLSTVLRVRSVASWVMAMQAIFRSMVPMRIRRFWNW